MTETDERKESAVLSDVRKKGILLIASFLLLLSAGVYMAFAWYTKMTSASDMTFDTAYWEYSANYQVENFTVNVYTSPLIENVGGEDFRAIEEGKAAPGTCGYAPIKLSAANSEVAVGYVLRLDKSTMSTEFQERIFFYKDAAMTQPVGNDVSTNAITGTIPAGGEVTVNIYWKWAYDLAEAKTLGGVTSLTTATDDASFDAFDTKVGMHPDQYEPYMQAQIQINGTQIQPGKSDEWASMAADDPTGTTTGTTEANTETTAETTPAA